MKQAYILGIVSMMALSCFGQRAKTTFAASLTGMDRMSMVKNSIQIPATLERSFWPMYEKYQHKMEGASLQTFRAVDELARLNFSSEQSPSYQAGRSLLDSRYAELEVLKQYYMDIGTEFNGIVAFQFLQTEALLSMMETVQIYEETQWKKYRFHSHALESTQYTPAKYNTISKALNLSPENAGKFYAIYARYELECNDLLGEDYDIYGLYAGEPADYTPGLSKRLGYDLLSIMKRELKLKEKYFNETNNTLGGDLAARFLTWEDYYSIVSRMYSWSDGLN